MMMMLLLANRRLCSMTRSPHIRPLFSRFFSASASNTSNFILSDYLIYSFGFSPDKAARVSKRLAHFKSPEKPDSVRLFLQDQGFSESDVQKLVTSTPDILGSSPEKTLDPNLRALRNLGLSTSTLNQIILSVPQALQLRSSAPRISFWMDFFDHDEVALVKALKLNVGLVSHDIARVVSPKISFLRTQGFSTHDIQRILVYVPRGITCKISLLVDILNRAREMGFQHQSGMFVTALRAMNCNSREVLQEKMHLLRSFGWSEDDLLAALRKNPSWLTRSGKSLQATMDFLMREAMCEPSYIALRPVLLSCSLEKRLRPRHRVMCLLESKGFCSKVPNFFTAMMVTDKQFVERFIVPHKEVIPDLHEQYVTACTSKSG